MMEVVDYDSNVNTLGFCSAVHDFRNTSLTKHTLVDVFNDRVVLYNSIGGGEKFNMFPDFCGIYFDEHEDYARTYFKFVNEIVYSLSRREYTQLG